MADEPVADVAGDAEPEVHLLLRRWFQARDQAALDALLRRCWSHLHRYAHDRLGHHLRSKEDTGDVVQEAVLDFMRYTPSFEVANEQHLRALLYKLVDGVLAGHHHWFARMRRDVARERPLPSGTTVGLEPAGARDPSPSKAAQADEREASLRLAITSLPPLDQKIVILRTYKSASFVDIAAEVGLGEEAARKRYARALKKLSAKLQALADGRIDDFLA